MKRMIDTNKIKITDNGVTIDGTLKADSLTDGTTTKTMTEVLAGGGGGTSNFDSLTNRPKYKGVVMTHETDIPEVKTATWDGKQDAISDLADIRSGAALGATAVQPADLSVYRTSADQDVIDAAQDTAIAAKSTVTVAASGTATDTVQYITIDGVEKKLAGGGGTTAYYSETEPSAAVDGDLWTYQEGSGGSDYLKNAEVSALAPEELTITKGDDTTVVYKPVEALIMPSGIPTNLDYIKIGNSEYALKGTQYSPGVGINIRDSVYLDNAGVLSVNGNTGAITGIATETQVNNKVSKTGDTMSGALVFTTQMSIKRNTASSNIYLHGGKDMTNGATIELQGCDNGGSEQGGRFYLYANNGSDLSLLEGVPGGDLYWKGEKLINSSELSTSVYALLQQFYDGVFPVNSIYFGFQAPGVPAGVSATWTDITTTYDNRYPMAFSSSAVGELHNETLPNISGSFDTLAGTVPGKMYQMPTVNHTGCFSALNPSSTLADNSGASDVATAATGISFNAHNSNSIYTDGAHVKPNTFTIKVWKRTA